MKRTRTSTFVM